MTRFHQYLQSGKAAGDALAAAQRDFINQNFENAIDVKSVSLDATITRAVSAARTDSKILITGHRLF